MFISILLAAHFNWQLSSIGETSKELINRVYCPTIHR